MHVMCLQAEALVEDGVLLPYNTGLLFCQLMRVRQQVELWREGGRGVATSLYDLYDIMKGFHSFAPTRVKTEVQKLPTEGVALITSTNGGQTHQLYHTLSHATQHTTFTYVSTVVLSRASPLASKTARK